MQPDKPPCLYLPLTNLIDISPKYCNYINNDSDNTASELQEGINALRLKYENLKNSNKAFNYKYDINTLSNDEAIMQCDIALVEQTLQDQIAQFTNLIKASKSIKQNAIEELQSISLLAQQIIQKVKKINKRLQAQTTLNAQSKHITGRNQKVQCKYCKDILDLSMHSYCCGQLLILPEQVL